MRSGFCSYYSSCLHGINSCNRKYATENYLDYLHWKIQPIKLGKIAVGYTPQYEIFCRLVDLDCRYCAKRIQIAFSIYCMLWINWAD